MSGCISHPSTIETTCNDRTESFKKRKENAHTKILLVAKSTATKVAKQVLVNEHDSPAAEIEPYGSSQDQPTSRSPPVAASSHHESRT